MDDKQKRVAQANAVLKAISSYGRRFFYCEGRIARFELDPRGRVWFIDDFKGDRIFVAYRWRWRGFSHGGTMESLVRDLYQFIRTGAPMRNHFGPWPSWICGDGDLWGYGREAMAKVRDDVLAIGVLGERSGEIA